MAETGYSSVGGRAVVSEVYRAHHRDEHTEEAQAVALGRTFVLALATGELSLVAWYRINDLPTTEAVIGDDNNRHLGVRRADGAGKPALVTFTLLTRWFQQPYRVVKPVTHGLPASASPVKVHAFALHDGRQIIAAWLGTPATPPTDDEATNPAAVLPPDMRHASIHVSLPKTRVSAVNVIDAVGKPVSLERFTWRNVHGMVELDLSLRGSELLFCELQP